MAYDKTIFKPAEITTLGRYRFSVVKDTEDTEDTSGQSDASADAPSQFDLGDFSNLEPSSIPGDEADTAADKAEDKAEDELPLLGGPATEQ